ISTPMTAATITDPKIVVMSPPPERIARIVATLAKETPCTSGSCEPKNGSPTVCRRVAKPPMNKHEAISRLMPVESSPAAFPTISGTAMMPPYMVRTCCSPYAKLAPTPSRSSSGRFPLRTAVAEVIGFSPLRPTRSALGNGGVQAAASGPKKQGAERSGVDRDRPHSALADHSVSRHGEPATCRSGVCTWPSPTDARSLTDPFDHFIDVFLARDFTGFRRLRHRDCLLFRHHRNFIAVGVEELAVLDHVPILEAEELLVGDDPCTGTGSEDRGVFGVPQVQVVEQEIQHDREDRGRRDARTENDLHRCGELFVELGGDLGDQSHGDADGHDNQVHIAVELHVAQRAHSRRGDTAEQHDTRTAEEIGRASCRERE